MKSDGSISDPDIFVPLLALLGAGALVLYLFNKKSPAPASSPLAPPMLTPPVLQPIAFNAGTSAVPTFATVAMPTGATGLTPSLYPALGRYGHGGLWGGRVCRHNAHSLDRRLRGPRDCGDVWREAQA